MLVKRTWTEEKSYLMRVVTFALTRFYIVIGVVLLLVAGFIWMKPPAPAKPENNSAEPVPVAFRDLCAAPFANVSPFQFGAITKPGAILVSIVAQENPFCHKMIDNIFKMAKDPKNVYVSVVQKTKTTITNATNDCAQYCNACVSPERAGQIKIMTLDVMEKGSGEGFARHKAQSQWDGQQFYMQVDSAANFALHWDMILKGKWTELSEPNAVIALYAYPDNVLAERAVTERKDKKKGGVVTAITQLELTFDEGEKIPRLSVEATRYAVGKSIEQKVIGGNFFLQVSTDVPAVDPFLHVADYKTDFLYSARLWTSGFNFYTIPTPILLKPDCNKDSLFGVRAADTALPYCATRSSVRPGKILLKNSTSRDILYERRIKEFGMGTKRTFDEYTTLLKINLEERKGGVLR